MSDHAQALMISTRVHAIFGYTLMLAGVTRIIEVCYFAPSFAVAGDATTSDGASEHTLAGDAGMSGGAGGRVLTGSAAAARSFRYLPPFVSGLPVSLGTRC